MASVQNKTILITGATSGFGEATARLLAKEANAELHLILTGRHSDRLEKLKKELNSKLVTVSIFAFDISKRALVEKFIKENEKILNEVDVLINNAGLALGLENFQNAKIDDWEIMIDTNVKGLLYITRLLIPFMLARKKGHIVNIGSVAGHAVYPSGSVYCMTKFAVRAFNEALKIDTLGSNIRVTSIDPGKAETEFSLVRFKGDAQKAKHAYEGMTPLKASDIAETIVWCLNRPAHVNIQELVILPTDQASVRDVFQRGNT